MGKTKTANVYEVKEEKKEASFEVVKSEEKKEKQPKVRSKSYQASKTKIESGKSYTVPNAIKLVKEISYSKFEGSMELHIVVKKAGSSAQVTLPYSGGKQKKIEIATDVTIKKLQDGKKDFDILLATADMMPKLVAFARILGPKGLMPNPKNGTIIKSEKDASKFSGNTLSLKTEKDAPLIHIVVGKVSQKDEELVENIDTVLKALGKDKQVVRVFLKSTMSPSVKLII